MVDPESQYGKAAHPDIISLSNIPESNCVILLGEPGIGKSTTMEAERVAIEQKVVSQGGLVQWFNLRSYGSETRLISDLFDSQAFHDWLGGDQPLFLFLDSLDECLLRVKTVAAILGEKLEKCPHDRLFLRIACRTAEWPLSLEENLQKLWDTQSNMAFELLPLRKKDVIAAAEAEEIDVGAFTSEIASAQVVPLAIKPVTLAFLLNLYKRGGALPPSQVSLYLKGCQLLCDEPNQSRRDSGETGNLNLDQRLAIAQRIAAVTIFSGRNAVWSQMDQGNVLEEDVELTRLSGGAEQAGGTSLEVDEQGLREVLATGLFSSRGPGRVGWAHQSYAEFLAAMYLSSNDIPEDKLLTLLCGVDGRVITQLRGAAAWSASISPEVFQRILKADPEVLLSSDTGGVTENDIADVVTSLLNLYDQGELFDVDLRARRLYRWLSHPGLADQLRPVIQDSEKSLVVRRVAIDIAEACALGTVQDALLTVALSDSDPYEIRTEAAFALTQIGDDDAKKRLQPLAEGSSGYDPDDKLKGCGLLAVWPKHISVDQLFTILTPRQNLNSWGIYEMFLRGNLVEGLKASDMPRALEWAKSQAVEDSEKFSGLADDIIIEALDFLDVPDVSDSLAEIATTRLRADHEVVSYLSRSKLSDLLKSAPDKKRKLIEAMMPLVKDHQNETIWWLYGGDALITAIDFDWLTESVEQANAQAQSVIAQLLGRICNQDDWRQVDRLIQLGERNEIIREELSWLFSVVELDSEQADKLRLYYQQRVEIEREVAPIVTPSIKQRVENLLRDCEKDATAFWKVPHELTFVEADQRYGLPGDPDLTQFPAWQALDEEMHLGIIAAAKYYLLKGDPESEEWLGTNSIRFSALAGFQSLRLLHDRAPAMLGELTLSEWEKWAPVVLAYPYAGTAEDEKLSRVITGMTYKNAPDGFLSSLDRIIDAENAQGVGLNVLGKLEHCWDHRMTEFLEQKSSQADLGPKAVGGILGALLHLDSKFARARAYELVREAAAGDGDEQMAVAAAGALMTQASDAGWEVIWELLQQKPELGAEVLKGLAHGVEAIEVRTTQHLTPDQLADLFVWLVERFPPSEDPQHQGAYAVGPRDSLGFFRDNILLHLQNVGTYEACDAIRKIQGACPALDYLGWVLFQAQSTARASTWTPTSPSVLLELVRRQETRLVSSAEELTAVILESLGRIQQQLVGHSPASREIWDKVPGKEKYRPNDENTYSDWVKRRLEEDLIGQGIVVNREVQIRPGHGTTGERTDLHVNAVAIDSNGNVRDVVTVVIETKGCWHKELNVAMEGQLRDRYLKESRCTHGVYLVGWFNCDAWDEADPRRLRAPKNVSIDQVREKYDRQAEDLSAGRNEVLRAFVMDTALR